VQKVVDLRHQGLSMRSIATELDVSTTIVQKSLKMSIVAVWFNGRQKRTTKKCI